MPTYPTWVALDLMSYPAGRAACRRLGSAVRPARRGLRRLAGGAFAARARGHPRGQPCAPPPRTEITMFLGRHDVKIESKSQPLSQDRAAAHVLLPARRP